MANATDEVVELKARLKRQYDDLIPQLIEVIQGGGGLYTYSWLIVSQKYPKHFSAAQHGFHQFLWAYLVFVKCSSPFVATNNSKALCVCAPQQLFLSYHPLSSVRSWS